MLLFKEWLFLVKGFVGLEGEMERIFYFILFQRGMYYVYNLKENFFEEGIVGKC